MAEINEDNEMLYCGLPIVPLRELEVSNDPMRESYIRILEKKWVDYTLLKYYFFDSPEEWQGNDVQKQAVRDAFKEWMDLGIGLEFKEVTDPTKAEIRIGFLPGKSWSYVGRDCVDIVKNPNKRTMNFGWDLTTSHGHDTALHEIGHAIGFSHEHQNPFSGIVWDEEAVYRHFSRYPNYWPRDETYYNVIRKIPHMSVEGSDWDKDSIMHYTFAAGLILNPEEYQKEPLIPASGLSDHDIEGVRKLYPPVVEEEIVLKPYKSYLIEIEPGEQLNFVIRPTLSREYTIQTFGDSDTVMVLFEDIDGESTFLAGDDDSGTERNAKITTRLLKDKVYYLRLRLYYEFATGQSCVMLW